MTWSNFHAAEVNKTHNLNQITQSAQIKQPYYLPCEAFFLFVWLFLKLEKA